jgi:hypothetical protein
VQAVKDLCRLVLLASLAVSLSSCMTTGTSSETVAPTVTCIFVIGDCYDLEDKPRTDIETDHGDVIRGEGRSNSSVPAHSPLLD